MCSRNDNLVIGMGNTGERSVRSVHRSHVHRNRAYELSQIERIDE